MFSILIPTWNNLKLLQLCVRSVRENSAFPHQIVVHVNEGNDGTREWVKQEGIEHTVSDKNVGICYAMNEAAVRSRNQYLFYLNDDMYCCPGWDTALARRLDALSGAPFMLSGTAIEPVGHKNPAVIVRDFGRSPDDFREKALLQAVAQGEIRRPDFQGGGCVPNLVSREWWFKVGGYSTEFSPGQSSDNDFTMKMWSAGCRVFIGAGDSLVYHFRMQSTGRIRMNPGSRRFLNKWGISPRDFNKYYLHLGEPLDRPALEEPAMTPRLRWRLFSGNLKRRFR